MAAVTAWLLQDPLPYRACHLCQHGTDVDGQRMCTCRDVVQPARHQPVSVVRRPHGSCGPEATFLAFPGLQA